MENKLDGRQVRRLEEVKSKIYHYLVVYRRCQLSDINYKPTHIRNRALTELENDNLIYINPKKGRAVEVVLLS